MLARVQDAYEERFEARRGDCNAFTHANVSECWLGLLQEMLLFIAPGPP
jgi:hypothetical protein